MSVVNFPDKVGPRRRERVDEAIDMLREITARARHMRLGLVAYPIEDVEVVIEELTEKLRETSRPK